MVSKFKKVVRMHVGFSQVSANKRIVVWAKNFVTIHMHEFYEIDPS